MIKIKNLSKSFDSCQVIKGLSIDIASNSTLVILGRSGVGKSVLLKLIIGVFAPDEGSITIDDLEITSMTKKERFKKLKNIGMLFQGSALFDSMNIEENIGFFLRQHGNLETGKSYSSAEIKDMVGHALEKVGLAGVEEKMPSDLSGGMRKRAGLARLVIYRPTILLYDEPTTGLDPITAMQINDLILEIQEELQATSIVVTHDIISALCVGDRFALHEVGRIIHEDSPDNFMKIDHPTINFLNKTITQDPRTLRRNS
ncbi:ABC transporter ATP-binding protein [Candidatus Aerophobetes bacterium]|uniref:ABC transporter ATP-binding protein n=1 Tax=Aerophobetes bacterium TaxID=2030807 RepID=A0A2A4X3Z3_UNCAE|nr:MAG: ABC transporter ATP-binding protein [Candidatus Aerophobetes bacterium]